MKKNILITGIILILAMVFMGTCEAEFADEEPEYTDVVYSKDGSQVTVYLDGVGVPVTKAQRAMTRDLAMMSYDYLEVVFLNGTDVYRNQWELGQMAGISGSGIRRTGSYTANSALFAGKKSDMTLFGVGTITTPADGVINTGVNNITYSLSAIQTGLIAGGETLASATTNYGTVADSFNFATGSTAGNPTSKDASNSSRVELDSVSYPSYTFPKDQPRTTNAEYVFNFVGTAATYLPFIKHFMPVAGDGNSNVIVQKRIPRYMAAGRYMEPTGHIDTKTTVELRGAYPAASISATTTFVSTVPLQFVTRAGSGGIFSFYLQIPVYNYQFGAAALGGPPAERWYIRTGLGTDLYNLDDGVGSGGCVLMNVGMSASDWITIQWNWVTP